MTATGLRIFTERSRGSYDQLLAVAQASERLGFETFFRSDHHLAPTTTSPWAVLGCPGRPAPG